MRRLALLFLLLVPSLAMAGGLFSVSGTDKSLEYLGVIFGPMGNLPLGAGNILFSKLIYVLNQVILTLGFIIVSYTLFISTISTAQEGEVMGKKWSSIWVPARAATGIYLLLPSASGYCWIQIGVMWFLIQGIGAANTIWEQVLYSFQTEGSISEPAPPALEKTGPLLKGILEAKICQHELNTNPTHQTQLNNQQIVLYRLGDEMIWGTADGKKHCGKIILPSFTPPISLPPFTPSPDTERKQGIIASAIEDIDSNFDNVAIEADEYNQNSWTMANEFRYASDTLNSAVAATQSSQSGLNRERFIEGARLDGWIHAGSYYFKLVGGELGTESQNITIAPPAPNLYDEDSGLYEENQAKIYQAQFKQKSNDYFMYAVSALSSSPTRSAMATPPGYGTRTSLQDEAGELWGATFKPFSDKLKHAATSISTYISQGEGDPLVSIAKFGGLLVSITETAFFGALIGSIAIFVVGSIMQCANPLWGALQAVWALLIPLVMLMIALFWATGITFALYIPLIPFLVFTFAAISWLILVIEAIIASPLIALTLIVPSEDEIGKAGHALVILVGLFLRPALMVIGFVVSAKILVVAITMLNFGFEGFVLSEIGNIGIFGAVALIIIYAGIVLTIVHESFSLIYVLPDKLLRWMGGQAEGAELMGKVKEAGGKVEAGAGLGKGAMKGALSFAAGKAKGAGGGGGGGAGGKLGL